MPLVITSIKRSPLLPEVPAITEFYPGSEIELHAAFAIRLA